MPDESNPVPEAIEQLRIAHKMVDYIRQLCDLNSPLDRATIQSAAFRALAAIRSARQSLGEAASD